MSQITNFTQAAQVNDLAGNKTNQGWSAADHQIKLIQSEFDELKKGIAERNIHELRDGIADVLFTVYGLAHRCGIDADADYQDMMVSQLTKFDMHYHDIEKSLKAFEEKGIDVVEREGTMVTQEGSFPCVAYVAARDQQDDKGREIPKGKWLKGHRFQEPVFRPLPTQSGFNELHVANVLDRYKDLIPERDYTNIWLSEEKPNVNDSIPGKTMYLYLIVGYQKVEQPELHIAKKLGIGSTRSVMKQPPLEDLGEQDVRCLLTEYHNSHNADFDFIHIQLTRQHDKLTRQHNKLRRVIEDYENQGYHVNKIVI